MQKPIPYYFGTHPHVLEPASLEYSSFGALWYEQDKRRYIVGYGYGTSQVDMLSQFCESSAYLTCTDQRVIYDIYKSIRDKQQAQDWSTRKRLSLLSAFKDPWKDMDEGWYILRSRNRFPLHLSVVRRKKYGVWLEHAAVCEDEAELMDYIARAKQIHGLVSIKSMIIQGGNTNE
ncbi:hypothetical protein DFP94_1011360 [Fontibacillus phaseoli]|uniref:Uncharacterized protein n=1 Tax=Fontibacillus phaseoli TaxID=1416533 RepID=A0A369BSU9_9BACL|nr:hypothetical protein [Fontibacillus phaseoli]RCX23758.1 hypothetical protein DFP94_1011360 [Fontibacillus phaseoli]